MSWNYRIIRTEDKGGGIDLSIHEVYYNDGAPTSYTSAPATVSGEDVGGLTLNLAWMLKALTMPTLEVRDGVLVECAAAPLPERSRHTSPTPEKGTDSPLT